MHPPPLPLPSPITTQKSRKRKWSSKNILPFLFVHHRCTQWVFDNLTLTLLLQEEKVPFKLKLTDL